MNPRLITIPKNLSLTLANCRLYDFHIPNGIFYRRRPLDSPERLTPH